MLKSFIEIKYKIYFPIKLYYIETTTTNEQIQWAPF